MAFKFGLHVAHQSRVDKLWFNVIRYIAFPLINHAKHIKSLYNVVCDFYIHVLHGGDRVHFVK